MDGSHIQFDGCKRQISHGMIELVLEAIKDSLLPPPMVTWTAMLSAGSSLMEVLEAAEPDRERMMAVLYA